MSIPTAIVIGIEQYRQKLSPANFAVHDAQTVTDYLTKMLGFPEGNVITLLNDRALKSDFEKYFEKWLGNTVEPDGTVFIYYSGHGSPDPKNGSAYLVTYDGEVVYGKGMCDAGHADRKTVVQKLQEATFVHGANAVVYAHSNLTENPGYWDICKYLNRRE